MPRGPGWPAVEPQRYVVARSVEPKPESPCSTQKRRLHWMYVRARDVCDNSRMAVALDGEKAGITAIVRRTEKGIAQTRKSPLMDSSRPDRWNCAVTVASDR